MGTIIERPRKGGGVAYLAQIALAREGRNVRESRTFDRRPAAAAWIAKREKELSRPGAIIAPARQKGRTLADAINRYLVETAKAPGRTKRQVLRAVCAHDIADQRCDAIGSAEIVALLNDLRGGRSRATVANYLSHLSAVWAIARPAWGFDLDPQAIIDARKVGKELGYTGKSRHRDRRPTLDEMNALMAFFAGRRWPSAPMHHIAAFALFSTRRQEEITTLLWSDLDEEHARIMVRDMKNPEEKEGNNVWCDLPPEALRLIKVQPRTEPRIFPFTTDAISSGMTRACAVLGIEDLHFHDLRHEGVSRLFEMGRTIPQVASVSGHRSWSSLKRYAHLRGVGDRWAGWTWLAEITPAADA